MVCNSNNHLSSSLL